MVGEELQTIQLKNDFYRDGFRTILIFVGIITAAIVFLVATSIYLYVSKPPPVYFLTDNQWRTKPPVPVTDGTYPDAALLRQWLSNVVQSVLNFSFLNYDDTLKNSRQYFTDNGWQSFQNFLGQYATKDRVEKTRTFINGVLSAAPSIIRQGPFDVQNRYAWVLDAPVTIHYITPGTNPLSQQVRLNILIVRVPTLDNLYGVAIEKITLAPGIKSTIKFLGGENA